MKPTRTLLTLLALGVAGVAGCGPTSTAVGAGSPSTASTSTALAPATSVAPGGVPPSPATSPPRHVGSATSSVSSPVLPTTTTIKPVPITRAPVLGVIQLTTADSGSTFAMRVGQTVQVTLSTEGQQWGPVNETPTVLLVVEPAPAPPLHGQLVIWKAEAVGTVNVSAVGGAYCAAGTACPAYAILFNITIVIS